MNWPMPEKHASECWIHEGNCCDCGAGIANTMLAACKSSFEKQDNALFQEIIELKKDKQDLMSHLDSLRADFEKQGKPNKQVIQKAIDDYFDAAKKKGTWDYRKEIPELIWNLVGASEGTK